MLRFGYQKLGVGGLTRHSGYLSGYDCFNVEDRMNEAKVRRRYLYTFLIYMEGQRDQRR